MRGPFLGEFVGTMMLVLMGNGVVASILLKRSKAENAGWLAVTAGWAFAVLTGIFAAQLFGSPDAHLNPAITVAFAIRNHAYDKLLPFISAQLLGGFVGAVLVWLFYFPHWRETESEELKLACFATSPAIRATGWNLLSETIATAVLVLAVGSVTSRLVLTSGAAAGLTPYLVACLVWGVGLSLGGTTGYATNPARDLAPRIAHQLLPIAGKGRSNWDYAWVPVVGTLLGGAISGCILLFIERH